MKTNSRTRNVFNTVEAVLGILCILYYTFCASLYGAWINILYIWLMAAGVLLVKALVSALLIKKGVKNRFLAFADSFANAVFLLVCLVMTVFSGMVLHASRTDVSQTDCDCIIILGAGVRGNTPLRPLSIRIGAAYDYLSSHPGTVAVCSGGKGAGENISEADCIADILISRGIDESRLLREDRSTSTEENIRYSAALLEERGIGYQKLGIVTNSFHLIRAKAFVRSVCGKETDVTGIPAHYVHPLLPHYIARELVAFVMEARTLL